METPMGTLFGIGVGPGDPELITLKAARLLGKVQVVFTASSSKNKHSIAVEVAREHIPETTPVERLSFPMCRNRQVLEDAWRENAERIVQVLRQGKDAAFLTLGDCMTYSTYGYVARYVGKIAPEANMVAVPGIAAYQAAAARINRPLVEGEEALLILSGAKGGERYRQLAKSAENVVLMKAYKHVEDIRKALEEKGSLKGSVGVVNCGLPNEQIVEDIRRFETNRPDYWTLILARHENGKG